MIKPLWTLVAALLVSFSSASLVATKRQTNGNVILDGSFEDVPNSFDMKQDVTAGHWTLQGQAQFQHNANGDPRYFSTPYGNKDVHFTNCCGVSGATASQPLRGLIAGKSYNLTYYWRSFSNGNPEATMTVTFGSQTLDSFQFPVDPNPPRRPPSRYWSHRTVSFTAGQSSGTLTVSVSYPAAGDPSGFTYDFGFDNISITGN